MSAPYNLEELTRELASHFPPEILRLKVAARNPKTPEDFAWAVRSVLRSQLAEMERSAQHHTTASEDALTSVLARGLRAFGFDATTEEEGRGHADLTVKSAALNTQWLAEAKIHSGYAYLVEGLEQLLTRLS